MTRMRVSQIYPLNSIYISCESVLISGTNTQQNLVQNKTENFYSLISIEVTNGCMRCIGKCKEEENLLFISFHLQDQTYPTPLVVPLSLSTKLLIRCKYFTYPVSYRL